VYGDPPAAQVMRSFRAAALLPVVQTPLAETHPLR
jgi:hypothetical protein